MRENEYRRTNCCSQNIQKSICEDEDRGKADMRKIFKTTMMKYPIIGINVSDVKIKRSDPLKRAYICQVYKLNEKLKSKVFFSSLVSMEIAHKKET